MECLSGFTSISFTTSLTLGTACAGLFASFRCARVLTLPFRTSAPFLALYEMLWSSKFSCLQRCFVLRCRRFTKFLLPSEPCEVQYQPLGFGKLVRIDRLGNQGYDIWSSSRVGVSGLYW